MTRNWTGAELDRLRELFVQGHTIAVIAITLGKSDNAVKHRLLVMRLLRQSNWPDEKVAALKRLHAEGLAFSAIADEIGCTRNAAIGKAQRLGLLPRGAGINPIVHKNRKPRNRRSGTQTTRIVPVGAPQLAPEPFIRAVAADALPPLNKPILSLAWGDCRWPVNEGKPEYLFCGHPTVAECPPYCGAHMRLAHDRRPDRAMAKGPGPLGAPNWNVPR